MYTWGYIKENTLSKLNMSEEDANQLNFLSRFPYYANEAMTQICSAIKPNLLFYVLTITEDNINKEITFPEDFVSFSDDVASFSDKTFINEETNDDILEYVGYNKVICRVVGVFRIPYNARWFFFTKDLKNADEITAPADICDALPSYIASQCMKVDDELKAARLQNEYEVFLARIDNTSFKKQRTFHIGGDW